MVDVEPVGAGAFEEVHRNLLVRLNPSVPPERWRRLFAPPWGEADAVVGYGLRAREGGQLVGYLGALDAEVYANGRLHKLCNLTSWIVLPGYRSQSLALLGPVLRRRDVTVTNMTPTPQVYEFMLRMGFMVLEAYHQVLTVGVSRSVRAQVVTDHATMKKVLPEADRKVMEDHRPAGNHLAIVDPDHGVCYLMYDVVRRMRMRCARIYHIGDPDLFRRTSAAAHRFLFRRHGTVFMDFDARLACGEAAAGARRVAMRTPRLYRPAHPDTSVEQVPCTYSELALLGL
jgi:hypothetical protein